MAKRGQSGYLVVLECLLATVSFYTEREREGDFDSDILQLYRKNNE